MALIGAIAVIYNDVESKIESMCGMGLQLPIPPREVTSRINGIDGIIELTKQAAAATGFSDEEELALCETLGKGGFGLLKNWRDAVIHARVFDVSSAVGRANQRRGKVADVLLSEDALGGLYNRLMFLGRELDHLDLILAHRMAAKKCEGREKEQHEARIPIEWARYHTNRDLRLSLEPMPEFPDDTPDLERLRSLLTHAAILV